MTQLALGEARRCPDGDSRRYSGPPVLECDACVILPMDCITFTPDGEDADLRHRLTARAPPSHHDLYVADGPQDRRVMVRTEDVCLHWPACAPKRFPTGAWDRRNISATDPRRYIMPSKSPDQQRKRRRVRFATSTARARSANECSQRFDPGAMAYRYPAQHLPLHLHGLPTWLPGAGDLGRPSRRARLVEHDVSMKPADLVQGPRSIEPGRAILFQIRPSDAGV